MKFENKAKRYTDRTDGVSVKESLPREMVTFQNKKEEQKWKTDTSFCWTSQWKDLCTRLSGFF
jgi:hypothetical protein